MTAKPREGKKARRGEKPRRAETQRREEKARQGNETRRGMKPRAGKQPLEGKQPRDGRPGYVRIIGGEWRGRRLRIPAGTDVRPTPDRVRETLFNWLAPQIQGAVCLDLFAGTGCLGLEALSRGASEAWLVERDPRLAAALGAHVAALGARGRAHVAAVDAARFLREAAGPRFDVAFLDPPFADPVEPLLAALAERLRPAAFVYVERAAASGLPEVENARWIKSGRAAAVAFGLLRFEPLQCARRPTRESDP